MNSAGITDLRIKSDSLQVVARSFALSRETQEKWCETSLDARRKLLKRLRHLIAQECESLASLSAAPRDRPVAESMTAEVLPLLEACRFLENNLVSTLSDRSIGSEHRPFWLSGITSTITREPYGLILIIGPGNYPLLLPGVQVLQALAAGNSVVVKPGVGGWLVAMRFAELIQRAGFDKDLCIVLPESVEACIAAINERPDKVIFTGSASIGREILVRLSTHGIPSVMELSGSDAVIIRHDADLELAAASIAFGLTLNDGATCMAPRRAFVAAQRSGRFERLLVERIGARLRSGQYFNRPSQKGVSNELADLTERALNDGARLINGSVRSERNANNYPVVLAGVHPGADLLAAEHFASLLSIVYVLSDDEAISLANRHELGLGASIFTSDLRAADRLAKKLKVGMVNVNDMIIPSADARLPLGGRKGSGFGTTQGIEGLLEMTVPKVINTNNAKKRRAYEVLSSKHTGIIASVTQAIYANGVRTRSRGILDFLREVSRYRGNAKLIVKDNEAE